MVKTPGTKGRPAYWARSAKNDPPVVFPNLHAFASWQDGRKSPETIPTITDVACIPNDWVEAAEAEEESTYRPCNNEDSIFTKGTVPSSTRDVHARDAAASSRKRKLPMTSPESLPMAKRIHSTEEGGQKKRSQSERADKYKHLTQRQLREECWSRSIRAGGSIQDLIKGLTLDDAARAHISSSQEFVKEKAASFTSTRVEPSDRYTHMLKKDLQKACVKRSLPVGMSKMDLRRCLRLYDAARALGLTPEESLEAQRATFQHPDEGRARIEEITFGATPEKAVEEQPLGKTSQESMVDNGQRSPSLESSEDDVYSLTNSQTSSEEGIASSCAATQDSSEDSTQDRRTSDMCLGPAATPNYATMGQTELRSLYRSRYLEPNGMNASQLRVALTEYDKKLAEQANNANVEVDAEHRTAELGVAKSTSPPSVAFIDLDSSSQDDENQEQRTPLVDASAPIRKEPVSGYLWTVNTGQHLPVSTDAQVGARSMDRVSAEIYVSPYPPRPVGKASKTYGNGSSPRKTPYTKRPKSQQQPLVSLINLAIKDTKSGASESAHQETQMKKSHYRSLVSKWRRKKSSTPDTLLCPPLGFAAAMSLAMKSEK